MTSRPGGVLRTERRLISAATHEALRFLGRAHGRRRSRPEPGAQPHAMAVPADAPAPRIEWVRFTCDAFEERVVADVAELRAARGSDTVDWIHVQGFGDEAQLRALAEVFEIHPLALADIVNIPQRAKVDVYDRHQLIVLRMARSVDHQIELQQLSLVIADGWVLTFEEHPGDVFDPVRARLRSSGSSIRRAGADFLAYALIDAVVDGFFPVVDTLSDVLDDLEEAAIGDPEPHTLARIHSVRRLLIHLARTQRQQRDALLALSRQDDGPFGESVRPYLRDVLDHAIHVLDTIEVLREMTVGVMDIYLSSVSNRTNDAMKTLTVMASLFIPLSFIAGVFGMNFDYMPELHWRWGYAAAWAVMVAVAVTLLSWFGRRGWLGALRRRRQDEDGTKNRLPDVRSRAK
jgi:magnesium transporter